LNALIAIYPYKYQGLWVFDDEKVGLCQEPFISGADTVIDRMTENIPDAVNGFRLIFSTSPFPGCNAVFQRRHEDSGGYWYYSEELDQEGWLCPALFKYFDTAPATIYAKFEPKDA
jgi:hypothetical protein